MSEDNVNKSVVLPLFSGKDKYYIVLWPRFHAYAVLKEFDSKLDSATTAGKNIARTLVGK